MATALSSSSSGLQGRRSSMGRPSEQLFPKSRDDLIVQEVLGEGSVGIVHRVLCRRTGRSYALKVISKQKIIDNKLGARLASEVKLQLMLNHPNILRCYAYFEEEFSVCLVLELAETELYRHMKKNGALTEQQAANIFAQVAQGLVHLHEHGVIHRDLKPENVLLNNEGRVKICDFGWAAECRKSFGQDMRQTFCGTPCMLAPEMVTGQPHDNKVDIWALGVLLYEMLTGVSPFEVPGGSLLDTCERIVRSELGESNLAQLPAGARPLVAGLLRKDPCQRLTLQEALATQWVANAQKASVAAPIGGGTLATPGRVSDAWCGKSSDAGYRTPSGRPSDAGFRSGGALLCGTAPNETTRSNSTCGQESQPLPSKVAQSDESLDITVTQLRQPSLDMPPATPRGAASTSSNSRPAQSAGPARFAKIDERESSSISVEAQLRSLKAAKAAAVEAEDYVEAARLKQQIFQLSGRSSSSSLTSTSASEVESSEEALRKPEQVTSFQAHGQAKALCAEDVDQSIMLPRKIGLCAADSGTNLGRFSPASSEATTALPAFSRSGSSETASTPYAGDRSAPPSLAPSPASHCSGASPLSAAQSFFLPARFIPELERRVLDGTWRSISGFSVTGFED